jgi:thiosulfate dehydrogenase [quinone] large subunit
MPETVFERSLLVFLRVMIGWTFLYAGVSQLTDPAWSAAGFLGHTKTFHFLMAPFAAPGLLGITNFLVPWGHLLIGLSLVFGIMVRVGALFGTILMLTYWLAHMNFPYVDTSVNFLIDFHVIYAGALVYLICKHAGHIYGLDGWLDKLTFVQSHPALHPLIA